MDQLPVLFDDDQESPVGRISITNALLNNLLDEGMSFVLSPTIRVYTQLSPVVKLSQREIIAVSLSSIPAWEKSRLDEETKKIIENQAAEIARLKQLLSGEQAILDGTKRLLKGQVINE